MTSLDEINLKCASSYEQPELEVNGYRIHFRGYVPGFDNAYLVGVALAWPAQPRHIQRPRFFAAVAGMDTVQEYKQGEHFNIEWSKMPQAFELPTMAQQLKAEAVERLAAFIEQLQEQAA